VLVDLPALALGELLLGAAHHQQIEILRNGLVARQIDGRRFVVQSDEKLTAFLELEGVTGGDTD
jgi:hypothetical protein